MGSSLTARHFFYSYQLTIWYMPTTRVTVMVYVMLESQSLLQTCWNHSYCSRHAGVTAPDILDSHYSSLSRATVTIPVLLKPQSWFLSCARITVTVPDLLEQQSWFKFARVTVSVPGLLESHHVSRLTSHCHCSRLSKVIVITQPITGTVT